MIQCDRVCCYSMERLAGEDVKVFGVPEPYFDAIFELMERFEAAGIGYMADASVFGWEDPSTAKFIDFALYDVIAWS